MIRRFEPVFARLFVLLVLLTSAQVCLRAQESSISPDAVSTLQLEQIDFSQETISQAGPSSFYVRGVKLNGQTYSITLSMQSDNEWTVTGIVPEDKNTVPPNVLLDFASVSKVSGNSIVVDGIIMDGKVYQGTLSVRGMDSGAVLGNIQPGSLTDRAVTTADQFRQLLFSREIADFQKQLAAQQQDLQARNDKLQQERDALVAQRDALQQQVDQLNADAAAVPADQAEFAARLKDLLANNKTLSDTNATLLARNQELALQAKDLEQQNAGLGGQNKTVAVENQHLQDQIAVLKDQEAEIDKQNQWLATQVDSLKTLIASLQSQNTGLLRQVSDLEKELASYRTVAGAAGAAATNRTVAADATTADTTAATGTAVTAAADDPTADSGTAVTAAEFSAQARALRDQIQQLQAQISDLSRTVLAGQSAAVSAVSNKLDSVQQSLSNQIADIVAQAVTGNAAAQSSASRNGGVSPGTSTTAAQTPREGTVPTGAGDAALRAEIARLQSLNQELTLEKNSLQKDLTDTILKEGYINLFRPLLTRVLYNGFGNGDPQIGSWRMFGGALAQTDPRQYFAKYSLPVPQVDRPTLYTVSLRSTGSGWVGVGLHIFASDVQSRKGYGLGKSLLVWLTRDRDYYRNDNTYLQLYRSDDDVNMGRVLDAKIPESLGDYLKLEILYEPTNEYITISVNGQEKVRYKTWFGIDAGITVALRTLGAGGSFSDFQVRTTGSPEQGVR